MNQPEDSNAAVSPLQDPADIGSLGEEGSNLGCHVEDDKSVASGISASSPSKRKKKFRKAPQAPRRFKSPYILFSIHRMAEYKKSMKDHVQVTSFSRQIAQDWKNLPEDERQKWEEGARQDKVRYNVEKELYTGPWQVPSGRSRKVCFRSDYILMPNRSRELIILCDHFWECKQDPSAPKRPPSAFLFYSQTMRSKLKQQHPDLKNTEISKLLGQAWKTAPPEVQRPHIEREHREREVYKLKIAKWRKERKEQEVLAKQKRQAVTEQFIHGGTSISSSCPTTNPLVAPSGRGQGTLDGHDAPKSWGLAAPFFNPQTPYSTPDGRPNPSSLFPAESRDSNGTTWVAVDRHLSANVLSTGARSYYDTRIVPVSFSGPSEMSQITTGSEGAFSSDMPAFGKLTADGRISRVQESHHVIMSHPLPLDDSV